MNLKITQGINEAWFIYDGNKVKLGSHDKELIEKIFNFLKNGKSFTKEDLKKAWLHGELRVPEELKHCNNFEIYYKRVYDSDSQHEH